jgi:DNA-binding protein HU-beta
MTLAETKKLVDNFLDSLKETLIQGKDITFIGFGGFSVIQVPEKMGTSPVDGSRITIKAHRKIKFHYSKTLKEDLNKQ